jgi:hypothetical protein
MITWLEYKKNIEKKEEKLGLDLDKDKEKGESKEHIAKIKKAKQDLLKFFKDRKQGAINIASQAKSKNTDATQLTAWHFAAKRMPYDQVIAALNRNENVDWFRRKVKILVSKLNRSVEIGQKEFQELVGEIEVFGEVLNHLTS